MLKVSDRNLEISVSDQNLAIIFNEIEAKMSNQQGI